MPLSCRSPLTHTWVSSLLPQIFLSLKQHGYNSSCCCDLSALLQQPASSSPISPLHSAAFTLLLEGFILHTDYSSSSFSPLHSLASNLNLICESCFKFLNSLTRLSFELITPSPSAFLNVPPKLSLGLLFPLLHIFLCPPANSSPSSQTSDLILLLSWGLIFGWSCMELNSMILTSPFQLGEFYDSLIPPFLILFMSHFLLGLAVPPSHNM